jgi:hypothetical protein
MRRSGLSSCPGNRCASGFDSAVRERTVRGRLVQGGRMSQRKYSRLVSIDWTVVSVCIAAVSSLSAAGSLGYMIGVRVVERRRSRAAEPKQVRVWIDCDGRWMFVNRTGLPVRQLVARAITSDGETVTIRSNDLPVADDPQEVPRMEIVLDSRTRLQPWVAVSAVGFEDVNGRLHKRACSIPPSSELLQQIKELCNAAELRTAPMLPQTASPAPNTPPDASLSGCRSGHFGSAFGLLTCGTI